MGETRGSEYFIGLSFVNKIWTKFMTTSLHDDMISLYGIKFDKKFCTSHNYYPRCMYGHKRVDKVGKKTEIEIVTTK